MRPRIPLSLTRPLPDQRVAQANIAIDLGLQTIGDGAAHHSRVHGQRSLLAEHVVPALTQLFGARLLDLDKLFRHYGVCSD